jgi:CubicO group peptidase (beta-lactamase class C family)
MLATNSKVDRFVRVPSFDGEASVKGILCLAVAAAISFFAAIGDPAGVKRLDSSVIASSEIDGTVMRLMKAAEVPSAGIALFDDGKIAYLKAYGVRDKEKNLPLTIDSVMCAASFTKVAFAYMVMRLVDRGVLDLDRPVYQDLPRPLPEYPNYTDLAHDQRYKQITARILLSHTSGFPNWRSFEEDHKLKIHFQPGARYAYSGEGIVLLQLVVETITKRPLEELMQEHVFQPFGMTRTSMVWQDRFESDYASGYDEDGRLLGPQKREKADAAGSMQTTIGDFARFMQAVMLGRGLRKETRKQMVSPQIQILSKHQFPTFEQQTTDENKAIRLSYGLGWGLYWTPYGKAFFKEGHDSGWRNYTVCFDKAKTGIVIMTNSGNGEGIFKELLESLLKNSFTPIEWEGFTPYGQLPPRAPLKAHKEVRIDPKLLERYVGRYGEPPNLILTIRLEGDHLSVQENDEPRQDLFPESEMQFFAKASDDVFTFEVDKQGQTTKMVLHTEGQDIPIKRID